MELNIAPGKFEELLAKRRRKESGAIDAPTQLQPEENDDSPIRHILFPSILAACDQRCNTYLVGPAGSGKSKACEQVAIELNLPYYCPPIGRETSIAQLFGYFNVQGEYVRTPLRDALERGGIIHFEEIDFASAPVGTALNSVLANDNVGFPDAVIPKHSDFIVIASANTFGTGATAQYIGSQGLNAATLDRFAFIEFPYDERMEHRIAPNKSWCSHVQAIRRKVEKLKLKIVVSPRATINGGKLLNSKAFTWEQVEKMTIFRGLDPITVAKIAETPSF